MWQGGYQTERTEGSEGPPATAVCYQSVLSPDIVKGFLPFLSLSSWGLKDGEGEKEMLNVQE